MKTYQYIPTKEVLRKRADYQPLIKALRSGKYKQGMGRLYTAKEDSYCCLGVNQVINDLPVCLRAKYLGHKPRKDHDHSDYFWIGEDGYEQIAFPSSTQEPWLDSEGLDLGSYEVCLVYCSELGIDGDPCLLADLNDNWKLNFKEIANILDGKNVIIIK